MTTELLTTPLPLVEPDVGAARRSLRDQVERLESELVALQCSSFPKPAPLKLGRTPRGGPRLLSIEELEALRDELHGALDDARAALSEQAEREQAYLRLREEMLRDPAAHRWQLVRNEDCGGRACGAWHVRPRLGLLGMLMNWWRVVISSGCP